MYPIKQHIDKKFEKLKPITQKTFGGTLILLVDYDERTVPVFASPSSNLTLLDVDYFMLRYFGIISHFDDMTYIDNLEYEQYIKNKIREKSSTLSELPPIRLVNHKEGDSFYKDYIEQ